MKYQVIKCRHDYCGCNAMTAPLPWKVRRVRGLEKAIVSHWPGQGCALDAALELAGLDRSTVEPTC